MSSNEELKRLIKKRGSIRAALTIFVNNINVIRNQEFLNHFEITRLQDRLDRILPLYSQFSDIQNEIDAISDDLDEQYTIRSNFEETYSEYVATAKLLLAKKVQLPIPISNVNSQDDLRSARTNSSTDNNNLQDISLPPIALKPFDGTYDNWLEFRDTFKALIHTNDKLSNMKKYHYLRGALEGTAARVIKSCPFKETEYNNAWDQLCERFDRSKMLIHNHVKSFFSIEPMHKETCDKIRALIDNVSSNLQALQMLDRSTENWDLLLIHIITSKLDNQGVRDWERHSKNIEKETWKDLKEFLRDRADLLENLESKNREKHEPIRDNQKVKFRDNKSNTRSFVTTNYKCLYCKQTHSIYSCDIFLKLPISDKLNFVKNAKLCENCLREGHNIKRCRLGPCRKCNKFHNTLLHPIEETRENLSLISNTMNRPVTSQVLLSTAILRVYDKEGGAHLVRALLDSGSQTSFITEQLCDKLKLNLLDANLSIYGISNNMSTINKFCNIQLHSLYNSFETNLTCYVLKEITSSLPNANLNLGALNIPNNIFLADCEFYKPKPIDILIGADLFWHLLSPGKLYIGKNSPILHETKLGWVVSGPFSILGNNSFSCNLSTSSSDVHDLLSKFWELEECNVAKPMSDEELYCEQYFQSTTLRDIDGRFVVSMPLKQSPDVLGESKTQAESRFLSLERKLMRNSKLRENYLAFIKEYQDLNHMSLVSIDNSNIFEKEYYMPHHGVLREQSLTTKLRVVFDASASSSTGLSLNNIQYVGPTLQDDLFSIIIRFRKHRYVFSADVSKMYRMVNIEPKFRNLQKILWREDPSEPLKSYTLNTVTYGQAAASYLAIKCLMILADECADSLPIISRVIKHDFYVDDLLSGADTIEQASYICKETSRVLKQGCFVLRKWIANDFNVLKDLNCSNISHSILDLAPDQKTKTLGLTWSCQSDDLLYSIEISKQTSHNTKRTILSSVARIFDPLGLLAPCTIFAKILLQKLWLAKISWDDPIPNDISREWKRFQSDLIHLNNVSIPRHVVCNDPIIIDLHGFSDASISGYGACIYLYSEDSGGKSIVNLLCAKSKVAPVKCISIPRLELCAALLLARLYNKVRESIMIDFRQCIMWSDSTIVLSWIRTSPNLLKTFVVNRVVEIQTLTTDCSWRHVSSSDNPADPLSRGLFPNQILDCKLWWNGPPWLQYDSSNWPIFQFNTIDNLPELKSQTISCSSVDNTPNFIFTRFSNMSRLKRVVAYILRFKNNCLKSKNNRTTGNLSVIELDNAFKCLIRISQRESFSAELISLFKNEHVNAKSKILSLSPFLDVEGFIRVGGRLKNSDFQYDKKYPFILNGKHQLTKLIFESEHVRLLHAGPQLLLSSIRNYIWPTSGRNLARTTVNKCLKCFRFNPTIVNPIMGNLPRDRVVPSSPFSITGVDYAGPFLVRDRMGRAPKLGKCYISIFICFATKAIHLELVSNLSTEFFILALRRFISRRGKPHKIYSDNCSNFVGASRELARYLKSNKGSISQYCSTEGIEWHFIPPYSPHFGGLWEAGVKSVKKHLKRVMGNAHLLFEELLTIINQIEAILNSRPLFPLSSDPSDLNPLTPAHFLIGKPLIAAPDTNCTTENCNRLTRFQLLQRVCQHFWQRWKSDYISQLQSRSKWKSSTGILKEGTLVLIKEEHTMPTEWNLGRVLEIHKGNDGIARVASIQTVGGILRRSFSKICPLPVVESESFQGGRHVEATYVPEL